MAIRHHGAMQLHGSGYEIRHIGSNWKRSGDVGCVVVVSKPPNTIMFFVSNRVRAPVIMSLHIIKPDIA